MTKKLSANSSPPCKTNPKDLPPKQKNWLICNNILLLFLYKFKYYYNNNDNDNIKYRYFQKIYKEEVKIPEAI